MTAICETEIIPRLRHFLPRLAPLLREHIPLSEMGIDSMDFVELLCAIDEQFHVRMTEDDFRPGHDLGALAKVIASKIQH